MCNKFSNSSHFLRRGGSPIQPVSNRGRGRGAKKNQGPPTPTAVYHSSNSSYGSSIVSSTRGTPVYHSPPPANPSYCVVQSTNSQYSSNRQYPPQHPYAPYTTAPPLSSYPNQPYSGYSQSSPGSVSNLPPPPITSSQSSPPNPGGYPNQSPIMVSIPRGGIVPLGQVPYPNPTHNYMNSPLSNQYYASQPYSNPYSNPINQQYAAGGVQGTGYGQSLLSSVMLPDPPATSDGQPPAPQVRPQPPIPQEGSPVKADATVPPAPAKEEEDPSSSTCVICLENPQDMLILECGHLCLCSTCAAEPKLKDCPMCRKPISRLVKVFKA